MKWAQINIQRGLERQGKIYEIVEWCDELSIDLVAISETGLCPENCFSEHRCAVVPHIDGWKWVGAGRSIRGGGVGFLIRNSIPFDVRRDLNTRGVEQIWIEVYRPRMTSILVCSVYIPPRKIHSLENFSNHVQQVCSSNRLVLILGDFNARSVIIGDSEDNELANALHCFLMECNLNLHNAYGVATRISERTESILDLTLSSQQLAPLVSDWQTREDLPSDHCAVLFSLQMSPSQRPARPPKYAWDLRNCDWPRFERQVSHELESWLSRAKSGEFPDLDQLYDSWLQSLMGVVCSIVPKRKLTSRSRAFWNPQIARLVSKRRRRLRVYRKYPTRTNYKRYKLAHLASRGAIREAKEKLTKRNIEFLSKANRNEIFNRFRRVTRSTEEQIPTLISDGDILRDRPSQVRAFNSYFSKAGEERNSDSFDNDFKAYVENFVLTYDLSEELRSEDDASRRISVQEVRNVVRRLGTHKAPGPDRIHPLFIKNGGEIVIKTLHFLFNLSFSSGRLPTMWKLAYVRPIPKRAGSKIANHRPISLLSIPGKLLDRIIAERISFQAERDQWFGPFQGGFRRGRSTTDQLLALRERISFAHRAGNVCVASFLDLSRAYDRTWRSGVIYKLIKIGLRGRILAWVANFLHDRFAAVVIDGVKSDVIRYEFGLPQGSCLSPVLFNVYLSDLFPRDFSTDRKDVGVFADDIRLACYEASIARASRMLSGELDKVVQFARKWRLAFDIESDKCGSMTFSFSAQEIEEQVTFGDKHLNQLTEYKHLGVIFDRRLTFKSHIWRVRQKAWAAFHRIRNFTNSFRGLSTEMMILMYKSFVQPVLEYACPVWSLAKDNYLKVIEPIHYAALRVATGARSSTGRNALDVYCGMWSPAMRREHLCCVMYFRAMRLDPTDHPLAQSYRDWANQAGNDVRSFFHYASSLVQAQQRFRSIQDGGVAFAEEADKRIISPWTSTPELNVVPSRDTAVQEHLLLFESRNENDIFVYTDGSCVENPGRAGIGVLCCTVLYSLTVSERVGIASILTAELCAIHRALVLIRDSCHEFLRRQVSIHLCIDNLVALRLSRGVWTSQHNWRIIQKIHREVETIQSALVTLAWHWTPSHEGIHGNEYADKLAKRAAFSVIPRSPRVLPANSPGAYPQPPIPASVSNSLTRIAISNRQREGWYRSFAEHLGSDHLSRIQLSTTFNPRFSMGNRVTQSFLAQLRFGHSALNAHKARLDQSDPTCSCGTAPETSSHFLLDCPLYALQRSTLEAKVTRVLPLDAEFTERTLLGGRESKVPPDTYRKIVSYLSEFLRASKRFQSQNT